LRASFRVIAVISRLELAVFQQFLHGGNATIPKNSIMNIINNIQNNHEIEEKEQKEIIHILKRAIDQNYLQFDLEHYKQNDGLTMGAPTLAILAETYIQNMEHTSTQIYHILKKKT
jgi:hypothetical protein